jgi:DNA-binding beta-propeller fold protein YncE
MFSRQSSWKLTALLSCAAVATTPALADIVVSSNDNHATLVNGALGAAKSPGTDTVSIIDVSNYPPKVLSTIDVPGSVVGPPMAVAVDPSESLAIISSSAKLDPHDKTKIVPDNRISVIDLKSSPPKVVQEITAGLGPSGVAISPDGSTVLIANRTIGSVSIFSLKDGRLQEAGKLDLGNEKSVPSGIRFLPDGKTALLTRAGDHMVSVLHVDGTKVTVDKRPLTTGVMPYPIDVTADGQLAVVGNMGRNDGDMDTVSLIDLTASPPRTIETVSMAPQPEGIKFSPDGKYLAVSAYNGTDKLPDSPFAHDHGRLMIFAVEGNHLRKVSETLLGHWSQGLAFSRDGKMLMAQNFIEQNIEVFHVNKGKLSTGVTLAIGAGPESMGTAWR